MPKSSAPKKPARAPSGRRAVPVQLWPEDEDNAKVILDYLRGNFPGMRIGLSDAVRHAMDQYARIVRSSGSSGGSTIGVRT